MTEVAAVVLESVLVAVVVDDVLEPAAQLRGSIQHRTKTQPCPSQLRVA